MGRKKIIVIVLVAAMVMTVFAGMASANTVKAQDWSDWEYFKMVSIKENSGKTLTDYQVLVDLSDDLPLGANPNGSDIRFVDADGDELSYWIKEFDMVNKTGKIWVKVFEIPANGTISLTMYYGNQSAIPMSNASAVFYFFDDFETGTLNKWNISTKGKVPYGVTTSDKHGGRYSRYVGPSSCSGYCYSDYCVHFTWDELVNLSSNSYNFSYWRRESSNYGGDIEFLINNYVIREEGAWGWYQKNFIYTGPITRLKIIETDITGQKIYFDDFFVRKYASPEPTVTVSPVLISTDKTIYTIGEVVNLTLGINRSGEYPRVVSLELELKEPCDEPDLLFKSPAFVMPPIFHWNMTVPMRIEHSIWVPRGEYRFIATLRNPSTDEVIGRDTTRFNIDDLPEMEYLKDVIRVPAVN